MNQIVYDMAYAYIVYFSIFNYNISIVIFAELQYHSKIMSHSLETFSSLLAQVPLELAIYQVESISFWLKCSTLGYVCKLSRTGYFRWKLLVTTCCYIVNIYQRLDLCFLSAVQTSCLPLFQSCSRSCYLLLHHVRTQGII